MKDKKMLLGFGDPLISIFSSREKNVVKTRKRRNLDD